MDDQTLLNSFFVDEADTHVRKLILDSINEHKTDGHQGIQKFEFNIFNVILNFETKEVTLEDVLSNGPESEFKLKMDEFEKMLQEHI